MSKAQNNTVTNCTHHEGYCAIAPPQVENFFKSVENFSFKVGAHLLIAKQRFCAL